MVVECAPFGETDAPWPILEECKANARGVRLLRNILPEVVRLAQGINGFLARASEVAEENPDAIFPFEADFMELTFRQRDFKAAIQRECLSPSDPEPEDE
jgi:hypothetical protein